VVASVTALRVSVPTQVPTLVTFRILLKLFVDTAGVTPVAVSVSDTTPEGVTPRTMTV
jgi:hypothetical protein